MLEGLAILFHRLIGMALHLEQFTPVGPEPGIGWVRLGSIDKQRLRLLETLLMCVDIAQQDLCIDTIGADLTVNIAYCKGC